MTDSTQRCSGPLAGVRVVEFAGLGPVPFACMLLSDMGADVVRIERPHVTALDADDITARGRRFVPLDLRSEGDRMHALELVRHAEIVVEGFRPGVMERLGLGPSECLQANPALVYGRMTGWGQDGPLSRSVGHDINYIAVAGVLGTIGSPEQPTVPLNLVGDYGGGAMYLLSGVLAALIEARSSGQGQVVDCAMVDGAISLMSLFQGWRNSNQWSVGRASNLLDGGAHFYRTYECSDGRHVAVGAIEPQFYAALRQELGLRDSEFGKQTDPADWPELSKRLASVFLSRTRDEWCDLLEGSDACVSPVLTLDEVAAHRQVAHRQCLVAAENGVQSAPAPRFSRTPSAIQGPSARRSADPSFIAQQWRDRRLDRPLPGSNP